MILKDFIEQKRPKKRLIYLNIVNIEDKCHFFGWFSKNKHYLTDEEYNNLKNYYDVFKDYYIYEIKEKNDRDYSLYIREKEEI